MVLYIHGKNGSAAESEHYAPLFPDSEVILRYVRSHPIRWDVPTQILYGENDALTSLETIRSFAVRHNAALTVMKGGGHWFHTEAQMRFLDDWISPRYK